MADIKKINAERLSGWEARLNEANSTPMVCVGCGHDYKAGEVTILIPEGISMYDIISILEGAAAGLKAGKLKLN
jgi:hypothetical protein